MVIIKPDRTSATNPKEARVRSGVRLEDFYSYMPSHKYIFVPSGDLWPAASVDARIGAVQEKYRSGNFIYDDDKRLRWIKASKWLDRHRAVEQMTWAPGYPPLIRNRLVSEGGWIERSGCCCFNLYRPAQIKLGDGRMAGPWLDHLHRIYPDDAQHIVAWLAHRVQRPQQKINHALVLGGLQGIGKDTLLEPVKSAVGPWNFSEVTPMQFLGRFNGFLKSVVLRVSEARDLGDIDRFSFYEHLKTYTAAPPDVLRIDEKNVREYAIWNVCGLVITTNHKTNGIFLPPDDRRHYVAWSTATKEEFAASYFNNLYAWYESGGIQHVTAYLTGLDLTDFDPKAPPPKTAAFWDIANTSRAPEDAELADALDELGYPSVATLADVVDRAPVAFADWLRDRRNSRQIPYRFETAGYTPVRNPGARDGLWRLNGRRQVIYARQELLLREQLDLARALAADRGHQ